MKRTSFLPVKKEGKEESSSCRLLQSDSTLERKGSPATTFELRCGEPEHLQSFEALHDWTHFWPTNVDFHGQAIDTNTTISPRSLADSAFTSACLASLATGQSLTATHSSAASHICPLHRIVLHGICTYEACNRSLPDYAYHKKLFPVTQLGRTIRRSDVTLERDRV